MGTLQNDCPHILFLIIEVCNVVIDEKDKQDYVTQKPYRSLRNREADVGPDC